MNTVKCFPKRLHQDLAFSRYDRKQTKSGGNVRELWVSGNDTLAPKSRLTQKLSSD